MRQNETAKGLVRILGPDRYIEAENLVYPKDNPQKKRRVSVCVRPAVHIYGFLWMISQRRIKPAITVTSVRVESMRAFGPKRVVVV